MLKTITSKRICGELIVLSDMEPLYLVNFNKAFRADSFLNKLSTPESDSSGTTFIPIVLEHIVSTEAVRQTGVLRSPNEFLCRVDEGVFHFLTYGYFEVTAGLFCFSDKDGSVSDYVGY